MKKRYTPYFLLLVFFVMLLCLPKGMVNGLRSRSIRIASVFAPSVKPKVKREGKLGTLMLQEKVERLSEELASMARTERLIKQAEEWGGEGYLGRRAEKALDLAKYEMGGQVGRVIFRDPSSWSSALWIDLCEGMVELKSPVLSRGNVVGFIDLVDAKRSRVRLITDS